MLDFNIRKDRLVCEQNDTTICADDFEIDKVYRFEEESDPDDEFIFHAISSSNFKVKDCW